MMSSIIAMLIVTIIVFFIARRSKNHRAFLNLMILAFVGFIVGATAKSESVANDETSVVNPIVVADTTLHPTLHCFSPAVVLTDENTDSVMSKETNAVRDSVSVDTERKPTSKQPIEIVDDS